MKGILNGTGGEFCARGLSSFERRASFAFFPFGRKRDEKVSPAVLLADVVELVPDGGGGGVACNFNALQRRVRSFFRSQSVRRTTHLRSLSLSLSRLCALRPIRTWDVAVRTSIVMIPFHTFRDRIPFLTCQRLATRDPFLLKESWRTLHGSLCDAGDGAVVVQRVLGRRRVSENPSGI